MASGRNNSNLQQLIDDHLDAVYRYAYRLTGAVHDAEDLTQQVFLLAQQRLDQLREVERARGWLFAILRNVFLRGAERPQPVPATSVGMNLETVPADSESSQGRGWRGIAGRRRRTTPRVSGGVGDVLLRGVLVPRDCRETGFADRDRDEPIGQGQGTFAVEIVRQAD